MFAFLVISTCLAVGHALPLDDENIISTTTESNITESETIESDTTVVDDEIDLSSLGEDIFGSPSIKSGEALNQWNKSSLMNPEEMGEYAEGDILFPVDTRNGIRKESRRWKYGIIPYTIVDDFNLDQHYIIMKAIEDIHFHTCLRFVPRNGQEDYLAIESTDTGCWSSVGRIELNNQRAWDVPSIKATHATLLEQYPDDFDRARLLAVSEKESGHWLHAPSHNIGGKQRVNLQSPGCVYDKHAPLHELLHAAGFMHQHSRPERDSYVDIRFENIEPGREHNFKKAKKRHTTDFGVPYDYKSIMHYSEYAFSENGEKTIEPKVKGTKIGMYKDLSCKDVKKINKMYNCKKKRH